MWDTWIASVAASCALSPLSVLGELNSSSSANILSFMMMRSMSAIAVVVLVVACIVGCDAVGDRAEEYIDETAEDILTPSSTSGSEAVTASAALNEPLTPQAEGSVTEAGSTSAQSGQRAAVRDLTGGPLVPSSPYDGLFERVPYTPYDFITLYINDYEKVRESFDTALSSVDDEDIERMYAEMYVGYMPGRVEIHSPRIEDVFLGPFHGHAMKRNAQVNQNLQHLGFDYLNMEQSIASDRGDRQVEIIRGRFDPDLTAEALKSCSECSPPGLNEHRGVGFFSWAEDYQIYPDRRLEPPAFDHVGRGGRIAVLDRYVYRTVGTPEMKLLIDASLGGVDSVADVPEFRHLADGLSRLGAYSMILALPDEPVEMHPPVYITAEGWKRMQEEVGPLLRPYEAYGTGVGLDEDGYYVGLAIVHADSAASEENAGLLRRIIEEESSMIYADDIDDMEPWTDLIDVDSAEIRVSGVLLLAKLRGSVATEGRYWIDLVTEGDSLFWTE